MRVYGDRSVKLSPERALGDLREAAARIGALPPGVARHGALVGLFIETAKLAQGVADHDMARFGGDGASVAADALMIPLMALARSVMRSWDGGFAKWDALALGDIDAALPDEVEVRSPEGYAYYGLYPEAYAIAARRLPRFDGPDRVIGVRSIGTGLAALVAGELGAPPPLTVRPGGHPFARRLTLADGVLDRLLVPGARYVVADEGPGLSGSSFAAVAETLMSAGVSPDRIVLIPSHGAPPGPEASPSVGAVWARVSVSSADPGGLVANDRIAEWASTLLGPLKGSVRDLSGGGWRGEPSGSERPPVDPRTERRKLLVRNDEGAWLVKFAGLGADGERKAERGRRLAQAGLVPAVRGVVHGFLVQRWIEDVAAEARPTAAEVARYLTERTRRLAAPEAAGAPLEALAAMAVFNAGAELGAEAAERLKGRLDRAGDLQPLCRPVAIDGKLDRWEWLRTPEGRLLKADALDHDADHDLVGPQDLAWDVAGAAVELGLPVQAVAEEAGRGVGRAIEPRLLAVLIPCYMAFRLGAARMAQRMQDPGEGELNARAAERYAGALLSWLADSPDRTLSVGAAE